ncbi:MAG: hypothetical protein AAF715_15190 [Myxococcota bacterium]
MTWLRLRRRRRRPRHRCGWVLPLALALGALTMVAGGVVSPRLAYAQKQSVDALIKKGQQQFDEQLYEDSIQTLSAALLRPGIATAEKTRVYQLLAYNYIVLQRDEEADGAVRGLLVLDPEYALPDTESPRFRDFFEKTREAWNAEGRPGLVSKDDPEPTVKPVRIRHRAPAQVTSGRTVNLDGQIDDPDASVDKVWLYYRAGDEGSFARKRVRYAMRKFTVDLPASAVAPPLVEYYLQAVDAQGVPVASRGDVSNPLRIAVPEEEASVITSPWLWVPVGIAVVAAVVIPVVFVTTQPQDSTVTVNVFDP